MKLNSRISSQPRKMRKYLYNLPHHMRLKMMVAPLTKEAREKYGIKRIPIRKGDTVIIQKGRFKGVVGKVVELLPKKLRVYVEGVTIKRAGGATRYYPIYPWNVKIIELDLSDSRRKEMIERKKVSKSEEATKTE
ncbi:MAG: 50S ribosomal protein L24 [Crenarchaeota archaeon]|nr:50S ribosomal protein L24 [Thermoproteota archaeon]MCR8454250.1 50S ribosomal protein L24 [Thermoproteota archaeon]MCR8454762.1 50S ribosomal protein L24 [Thermoproteota archaeon]MCR8462654.1 50S ribosomal protein L24 [Thermoproteota archaeon]MCR8470273.1 50S ribosomal protein L24 [Thermoproteota archaeon]